MTLDPYTGLVFRCAPHKPVIAVVILIDKNKIPIINLISFSFFVPPEIGSLNLLKRGAAMKTLGKVFFGMVCITLLFSCNRTQWVKSNNVTIKWNAPTKLADDSPIPSDQVLRYNVYLDLNTDKDHSNMKLMTKKEPIAETSYTIPTIEHKGRYFIGIEALTYKIKDGEIYSKSEMSKISWSSSKSNTKKGPFGVKIK